MDFSGTLRMLAEFLDEREAPYALVGGHALAAYGMPRATLDLDLVVEGGIQDDLIRFLEATGYETLHRSSGYSNHLHPEPALGRVDFIYIRDQTARELFSACREVPGPNDLPVPVPRPEHLIAMKAHALRNDPGRRFQEMADIRGLMTLPGVDRRLVRSYFEKRGLLEDLDEIERTL